MIACFLSNSNRRNTSEELKKKKKKKKMKKRREEVVEERAGVCIRTRGARREMRRRTENNATCVSEAKTPESEKNTSLIPVDVNEGSNDCGGNNRRI